MDQNNRTPQRQKFNMDFVRDKLDNREVHYVYCLVDRPTQTVAYFGVTNDPASRKTEHRRNATRSNRISAWKKKFGADSEPEFVILAMCPSRNVAEIMERCLIKEFNNSGQVLTNDYKYERQRLSRDDQMMLYDPPPWWEIDLTKEAKDYWL